jgi:nucleotide-binding universal stress UspA family protein
MLKMLIPADGSESAMRAVQHLIKKASWFKVPVEIHLLNVQYSLHRDVEMFLGHEQVRGFHHDEGLKALEQARKSLEAAGLTYVFHIGVGDPAEVIADYAKEKGCDQIIMGTRGLGSIVGLLLGSVAIKVIHLTEVPVLLVK